MRFDVFRVVIPAEVVDALGAGTHRNGWVAAFSEGKGWADPEPALSEVEWGKFEGRHPGKT